ncbi:MULTISPECIES: MarR family transcriptional regulator [unclassified Nonomuraea]|uniref:MarR family winged helix-turn-helix transcriptional regulator n=1 Tax=unclassified Nonomuraea TaxID=2593643 RepID=UPI0033CE84ED
MPRPPATELAHAEAVDISPVRTPEQLGILASLSAIIHWADSPAVRHSTMTAVGFPADDVSLFLTVNQLTYRGAMRPTQLADALGTGRPNITKITRRLVDMGLVVQAADPEDRRGVIIALSQAGRDLGEHIIALALDRVEKEFRSWDSADVEALTRLLEKAAQGAIAQGYRPRALDSGAGQHTTPSTGTTL